MKPCDGYNWDFNSCLTLACWLVGVPEYAVVLVGAGCGYSVCPCVLSKEFRFLALGMKTSLISLQTVGTCLKVKLVLESIIIGPTTASRDFKIRYYMYTRTIPVHIQFVLLRQSGFSS